MRAADSLVVQSRTPCRCFLGPMGKTATQSRSPLPTAAWWILVATPKHTMTVSLVSIARCYTPISSIITASLSRHHIQRVPASNDRPKNLKDAEHESLTWRRAMGNLTGKLQDTSLPGLK